MHEYDDLLPMKDDENRGYIVLTISDKSKTFFDPRSMQMKPKAVLAFGFSENIVSTDQYRVIYKIIYYKRQKSKLLDSRREKYMHHAELYVSAFFENTAMNKSHDRLITHCRWDSTKHRKMFDFLKSLKRPNDVQWEWFKSGSVPNYRRDGSTFDFARTNKAFSCHRTRSKTVKRTVQPNSRSFKTLLVTTKA